MVVAAVVGIIIVTLLIVVVTIVAVVGVISWPCLETGPVQINKAMLYAFFIPLRPAIVCNIVGREKSWTWNSSAVVGVLLLKSKLFWLGVKLQSLNFLNTLSVHQQLDISNPTG